ncbi:methyl-accepting chemotaxis protein [Aliagarivorans marinus]|uniref:methyl-accepting chemotaxis protein n=1 Tax=Aliagarivorans marinus TaxID=561965 RepID=UPI000405515D|nr:methyl-accepting chemotaxis protein [Aliagarivorans marinus]
MKLLTLISISQKITILIVTAVLGMLLMLLIVNQNVGRNSERLAELKEVHYPLLQMAQANTIRLDQIANEISTAAMVGEAEMLSGAQQLQQQILSSLQDFTSLGVEGSKVDRLRNALQAYYEPAYQMSSSMIDGTFDFANMASQGERVSQAQENLKAILQEFEAEFSSKVDEVVAEAGETSNATVTNGTLIGAVTAILVIVLGYLVSRSIVHAVNGVADSLKEISQGEGDLTVRLTYQGKDELGRMVRYFNDFVEKLQHTISELRNSTQDLYQSAENLSQASAKTNSQITAQGGAIEKTTHALNELFTSVAHIAEHAASASGSAEEANEQANSGTEVVQTTMQAISQLSEEIDETSETITQLEQHTRNVGSILDTIRGIAEQTNLLALNAAIEAARAGEQGRGFAVVADEVRSLASRTQDSTQEIQQVLEELQSASTRSVQAMSRGTAKARESVEQSGQAGDSLNMITDKVGGIVMINNQIAAATEEQNQTSQLIQQYVAEIQEMAQEAVTSTTELDVISQKLHEASENVTTVTNQFKV